MTASDFPKILQSLAGSARKTEGFRTAVDTLEAGRAAGAIQNARYLEAKDDASRSLEAGWSKMVKEPFLWNRDYQPDAAEQTALYAFDGHPLPHTLNTFRKRCDAVPEGPAKTAIREYLAEIAPLCELLTSCKAVAFKKVPAPDAPDPVEKYRAPDAPRSAMKMVYEMLKSITEGARSTIEDGVNDRSVRMLESYLKAEAENAVSPKRRREFSPFEWLHEKQKPVDSDDHRILSQCVEKTYDTTEKLYRFTRRPEADAMIRKAAEETSHRICAHYIEKNVQKLDSIISARGDFAELRELGRGVTPEAMEGRLRLSFEDGAGFEARTSVVFSHSIYGKGFLRFPLTFHDVILGDGTPMPRPSEKSMNEDFVAAKRTPESPSM